MGTDAVLLSRIQFAVTVGYHILWPGYTIGISGFIVVLGILWLRTRRLVYRTSSGSGSICLPLASPWG